MNKQELIGTVAETTGLSRGDASKAVEGVFESISGALKRGGYGFLSVGAIMATTPGILPAAIAELKRRRPLLTISLVATTSDRLLAALPDDGVGDPPAEPLLAVLMQHSRELRGGI